MRVLIITKNIKPDSGWGRYSNEVVRGYPDFDVEVLVLTEDGDFLPANSVFNFIKNCISIRKIARSVDIIHAFDGWPYAIYAWFAIIGTKKRFYINAIGTYSVAPLTETMKGFLLRTAYKKATAIFPISNFVKNKILEYVDLKNIHTVYLASSKLPDLTDDEIGEFKEKYNIKDNTPVILTVGEVKDRKGQYEVVQSVKVLKEYYPNILYLIIGETKNNFGYVKKINDFIEQEKLKNNIKIISDVNTDKELSFFYNICDLFILNAKNDKRHFEGFGLVMLEAASFGKSVVGVKGTALEETMADGSNGLLIDRSDSKSISDTIKAVIENKEFYGSNSFLFYKKFSWDKTISKYIEYYEK